MSYTKKHGMTHQFARTNPQKPLVQKFFSKWMTTGYDAYGIYHVEFTATLPEAHRVANDWAANGYPTKAAA